MKTIQTLALAMLLLSACTKDETAPSVSSARSNSGINLREAKIPVARPVKFNFYTTEDPDTTVPRTACSGDLPGFSNPGYFLHGTGTLVGNIISSQSRGQDITCDLSFATALLTTSIAGQIAAADGDLIYYTGNDEINVYNLLTGSNEPGTITGVWTITGGTGRFEGATGSFTINGPVDFTTRTFSFTGEGTITY